MTSVALRFRLPWALCMIGITVSGSVGLEPNPLLPRSHPLEYGSGGRVRELLIQL